MSNAFDLGADGLRIGRCQRLGGARPCDNTHTLTAARVVAGFDKDEVGTGRTDFTLDRGFGSCTQGNHGQHCSHTDDDAQHGEYGAHAIAIQRAYRQQDIDGHQREHGELRYLKGVGSAAITRT